MGIFRQLLEMNRHSTEDKKLRLFASFKTNEPYLDLPSDYSTRSHFAKLHLTAHNLHIEAGRYAKTPRSESPSLVNNMLLKMKFIFS